VAEYPIAPAPGSPALTESPPIPDIPPIRHIFGRGIITPFQRDGKGDIANGVGAELLQSLVAQVLGTVASSPITRGELPWRPDFGSTLTVLRHRKLDGRIRELARIGVLEALKRWIPEIDVTEFSIETVSAASGGTEDALEVTINYSLAPETGLSPGGTVIEGVEDSITIRL
jgi:phage baseplate assembly protein W